MVLEQSITNDCQYLIGPTSTPYEQGIWRLHLKMTDTFPREPPKASFRTKIFHPNVEERSGEVCVDTLKTGWKSETTLREVLSVQPILFTR